MLMLRGFLSFYSFSSIYLFIYLFIYSTLEYTHMEDQSLLFAVRTTCLYALYSEFCGGVCQIEVAALGFPS